MKTLILLATFASVTMYVPNATQTVIGQATTSARVGDAVKVAVSVEQTDSGLTEVFTAIPYNPGLLEYVGVEGAGLTGFNAKLDSTRASINTAWKGSLPAGESRVLGFVNFKVIKTDKSLFQAMGVNSTAKDLGGALLSDIEVVPSSSVLLAPRPLRLKLDITVTVP